ncbi:MAG TPA: LytTR family DNA-binding domain-containing protein [Puia sp.]
MKILIIEDEVKTARALARLITAVEPGAEIVASLQSVKSGVAYFSTKEAPDLIFMDVQLADGLCFDIFKEVTVPAPVIFCTGYDEYAIEGFKSNGIDYILKPFSEATLAAAFRKVKTFRNFFQLNAGQGVDLHQLLQPLAAGSGKNSFLVFSDNRYTIVPTEHIAFFYVKNELILLYTFDGREYFVNHSLDMLESLLPPGKFFRANRKYLLHFTAIKEVEHYFSRKLLIHLKVVTPEQLIVGKDKATGFLTWLDNR